jgi:hypothetical protein
MPAATATPPAPVSTRTEPGSASAQGPTQETALATEQPPAVEAVAPPAQRRIAIAFTPEVIDAQTATIPSGDFVVGWIGQEQRVILKPGLNFDVDPELWQKAQELEAVQTLIGQRAIEEIDLGGPTVDDTPAFGVTAIKTCDEATALRLVLVSRDAKQLEGWLAMEGRNAVRNSISRKLNQLKEGQS